MNETDFLGLYGRAARGETLPVLDKFLLEQELARRLGTNVLLSPQPAEKLGEWRRTLDALLGLGPVR